MHDYSFKHDDGGQAQAGVASALRPEQLGAVRAMAIVTGKPFEEIHAYGVRMAKIFADTESFVDALAMEFGLVEVDLPGHFGDSVTDLLAVRDFCKALAVRRLVLMVLVGRECRFCAIRKREIRDTAPLPDDAHASEVIGMWARVKDAGRLDVPVEPDDDEDDY